MCWTQKGPQKSTGKGTTCAALGFGAEIVKIWQDWITATNCLCDVCEAGKGLEHKVKPSFLPYASCDYQCLS